jgi:putative ABC transport system ATP-binding protein
MTCHTAREELMKSSGHDNRIIDLRGISKTFRSGAVEVVALSDITLGVQKDEFIALMGPSGSGKTTLLNLIAGLDRPTAGELLVDGEQLVSLSERQLTAFRAGRLGLVFQDPHLLPGLSALENVIVSRLPWQSRRQLEPEARELLDRVGLAERLDFPPARLSGGERQRVGIARALLGRPRLLLADEPTGNLDAATTEELLALLQRLRSDFSLTVITATHDPIVSSVAGRELRLAGGRLAEPDIAGAAPQ